MCRRSTGCYELARPVFWTSHLRTRKPSFCTIAPVARLRHILAAAARRAPLHVHCHVLALRGHFRVWPRVVAVGHHGHIRTRDERPPAIRRQRWRWPRIECARVVGRAAARACASGQAAAALARPGGCKAGRGGGGGERRTKWPLRQKAAKTRALS